MDNIYIDDKDKLRRVLNDIELLKRKLPMSSFDVQAITDLERLTIDENKLMDFYNKVEEKRKYNKDLVLKRMNDTSEDFITALENIREKLLVIPSLSENKVCRNEIN